MSLSLTCFEPSGSAITTPDLVDHDAILNVGVGTDYDRIHLTSLVDLVSTNDRIRTDKYIVMNNYLPADNGCFVDVRRLDDYRET